MKGYFKNMKTITKVDFATYLGVIESLSKAYISTQLANTIVFAVLIVVLLVKPAGLLGKYVPEKV